MRLLAFAFTVVFVWTGPKSKQEGSLLGLERTLLTPKQEVKSKQKGSLLGLERRLLTLKQEVKLIKVNDKRANWSVNDFTRFGRIGFSLSPVLKAKHFRKHLLPYCYFLHEDHISASLEGPWREFKTGFKTADVFNCVTSFQRLTTLNLFLVNILHCRSTLPKLLRTEIKLFVCDFLQNRLLKVKCNIKPAAFLVTIGNP